MSVKKAIGKFVVETLARGFLTATGAHIGEALGKKIGARINIPPPPPEPKSEETKNDVK